VGTDKAHAAHNGVINVARSSLFCSFSTKREMLSRLNVDIPSAGFKQCNTHAR
jgi:hypothetical protein